jgi:hypothetical protein
MGNEPLSLARQASIALLIASGAAGALVRQPTARADDAGPAPSGAVTGPLCSLQGAAPVAKGTQIFDAATAGHAVAAFTGAVVPLRMTDLPADPTTGRAKLGTSTGSGALRIDGFVPADAVEVFTGRDLPVAAGHVWIASAQRVRLVHAAANALTAEVTVAGSKAQTVRAAGACDAFTLERGTPTGLPTPPNGRAYTSRGTSVELFDEPNGRVVFTFNMSEGTAQLFWSTEARAGYVHVLARADLAVDAWARARDLDPLKKGEMMDQFAAAKTVVTGAKLSVDKAVLAKAEKEIPVRAKRDAKEAPIGAVETGAEVYLMETVAGWTNVLPKSLGFLPPDDAGFWIPAADAPKP